MSDGLKQFLMVAIENIVVLICFTILAIHFEKWWIVLFTAFFQTYIKRRENNE